MEQELMRSRFLVVLKKTRKEWNNDKKFGKLFKKMEKGKNLKKDEFSRLYFMLRDRGEGR